jgi:outer membrane lipoprotein carrier protein
MRRISEIGLWVCLFFLPVSAGAGQPTREEVIAGHCRARASTATVKAKFTQTKVFTLFDETKTSKGTLLFAQPDRICWQYEEPDKSSTVINGKTGWSVFPDIKQVQKFRLDGSKTNKVLSIIGFGECGTPLTESFKIKLDEGRKVGYVLLLKPTDPDITPYFSRIDLTLDRSDYMPRKIVLHEKAGDLLRFEFSGFKRNTRLDDSIFKWVVPEGYEVVAY